MVINKGSRITVSAFSLTTWLLLDGFDRALQQRLKLNQETHRTNVAGVLEVPSELEPLCPTASAKTSTYQRKAKVSGPSWAYFSRARQTCTRE